MDDAEGTGVTSYEIDDQELADIRAAAQAEPETGDTRSTPVPAASAAIVPRPPGRPYGW
ncbi:hypothetical protein [Streptomyces exfoliatus]|uniref:hypothetical protein n=1 Tax=Streptomyces exfoliatus TaxID=1905 RepID=UPI003C30DDB3